MAIIIVTVIFRILVAPLMHKQAKSSYQMQKVQPLMQEIQRKYADDPMRQQAGNAKAVCGSKVQSAGWLLADDSADAYLHCACSRC